jgi:hypothetical protein
MPLWLKIWENDSKNSIIVLMKIFIADNYAKMSKQAADDVIDIMQSRRDPLSAQHPVTVPQDCIKKSLKELAAKIKYIANWFFCWLDEWIPMNENEKGVAASFK